MRIRWKRMVRHWHGIACALIFTVACAPLITSQTSTPPVVSSAQPHTMTFTGTLERGQTFTHAISPDLTFKLIPYHEDWEMWIGKSLNLEPVATPGAAAIELLYNYSAPVTPPFYGINARHIEGWHFRNQDNSGPNTAGALNVNAPQVLRPFCFVDNQADYLHAQTALSTGLPTLSQVLANQEFPVHNGLLTITDMTLSNLQDGQKAWIEQMSFTVTLNFDGACTLF